MAAHAFDLMMLLDAPGVGPSRVRKLLKRWRETPELPVTEGRIMDGVKTNCYWIIKSWLRGLACRSQKCAKLLNGS